MADNYQVKDAAGSTITIRAKEVASGIFSNFVHLMVGSTEVSETNPVPVRGNLLFVSGEFTRPANTDAYAIGHVVADSTSAATPLAISGCVRVNEGTSWLVGAELIADQKSITPTFRIHIFNAAPTQSNDKAAHRGLYTDIGKRVGRFVLGPLSTPSDTTNSTISAASDYNLRLPVKCASGSTTLYFILETLTAFTPASGGKFTLKLTFDPN